MFSSNQEFKISGDFSQLQAALNFAIDYYEMQEKDLVFQTTKDGKYCIGWKPENDTPIVGAFYFVKTGDVENTPFTPEFLAIKLDTAYKKLLKYI